MKNIMAAAQNLPAKVSAFLADRSPLKKVRSFLIKKRPDKISISIAKNLYIGKHIISDLIKIEHIDWDRKYVANIAGILVNKMFLINLSGDQQAFYELHKDKVDTLHTRVALNESIKQRCRLHFTLLRYFYGNDINILPADDPVTAELLKLETDALSKDEFAKLAKAIHTEFTATRRDSKKQAAFDQSTKDIAENGKVNIFPSELPVYAALFAALFLITGYVYNRLYFGYFSLDLSNFYSVTDHLSSSADKIHFALLPLCIGIIISSYFIPGALRHEVLKGAANHNISTLNRIACCALAAVGTLLLGVGYFAKMHVCIYVSLAILMVPVLSYSIGKCMRYFKNPMRTFFVFLTTCVFFLTVVVGALLDIHHIMIDDLSKAKHYNIVFSKDIKIDDRYLVMIASNDRHFIFYDRKYGKTIIIPVGKIMKVEGINKPGTGLYNYLSINP